MTTPKKRQPAKQRRAAAIKAVVDYYRSRNVTLRNGERMSFERRIPFDPASVAYTLIADVTRALKAELVNHEPQRFVFERPAKKAGEKESGMTKRRIS